MMLLPSVVPGSSSRASRRSTAKPARAGRSGATVVRSGSVWRPSSMSSNPTTATSPGTARPRWRRASIAPSASRSLKQNRASTSVPASSRASTARTPPAREKCSVATSSAGSTSIPAAASACRYPARRSSAVAAVDPRLAPTAAMRRRPVATRCVTASADAATLSTATRSRWLAMRCSPSRTRGTAGDASSRASCVTEIGEKTRASTMVGRRPSSTSVSRTGSPPVCSTRTETPRAAAASMTAAATSEKYGSLRRGTASPTRPLRPVRRERADMFGR